MGLAADIGGHRRTSAADFGEGNGRRAAERSLKLARRSWDARFASPRLEPVVERSADPKGSSALLIDN